ncbi:unnamed protein product [Fusarium graminearum]|uniref:Uncharacterized protein n=1 Tax=Gibberella zeae TaxID=5518 RepID=A0A4E9EB04_GIBZA|nr:unnamed protein product [Fusarium graminearum]CAF3602794.1 unnamed protein product [Fusarium graminearum]CAG1984809.1 unnamed protein product [Fusarium graminearum]CAG2002432.1 unnamed protein product [Fusarium graminearum]
MIRDWRAEHRARLKKKNGRPRDRTGERARGGSHWVAIEMTLNIVAFWPPIACKLGCIASTVEIRSRLVEIEMLAHATVDGTKKGKDDETCHDPIGRYVSLLCFPVRQFTWMDGSSYACMYGNEEILATACVAHPAMMH